MYQKKKPTCVDLYAGAEKPHVPPALHRFADKDAERHARHTGSGAETENLEQGVGLFKHSDLLLLVL